MKHRTSEAPFVQKFRNVLYSALQQYHHSPQGNQYWDMC